MTSTLEERLAVAAARLHAARDEIARARLLLAEAEAEYWQAERDVLRVADEMSGITPQDRHRARVDLANAVAAAESKREAP